MEALATIRKQIQENKDSIYFGGMEETAELLRDMWLNDEVNSVYSDTEDRGDRWTLWEVQVFKVITEDETAYFRVEKEVGATENQSDGVTVVREVTPKEVVITKYEEI